MYIRAGILVLFALLTTASQATESALTQLERAARDTPRGLPVTIDIWNATPGAELTMKLHNGSRILKIEPAENPAPWFEGVTYNANSMTLRIPVDALPADDYSTLRLRAYLELGYGGGGHVELQKPLVFALRSEFGNATMQSGNFSFKIPALAPTCVVAGCARSKQCPDTAGGDPQTCYGYYEDFLCCSLSPYPRSEEK